jgi:hypothetical protein
VIRRGIDLVESGTLPAGLLDNFVGGLRPDEGLGVVVPALDPETDFLGQLCDGAEQPAAQSTVGQQREPCHAGPPDYFNDGS